MKNEPPLQSLKTGPVGEADNAKLPENVSAKPIAGLKFKDFASIGKIEK